ncbi:hypothetical protein [Paraburkholderia ferrariae]|uniref:Uncharacterized protein n=1 Tax=Paraburkholderia ferrariae TaxID=386056 RepID=A0ABU9RJ93_9BURK
MPKASAVDALYEAREDFEITSGIVGQLDALFATIEDLAKSGAPVQSDRIAKLASLGRFTAEGWRSTIVGMMRSITEAIDAEALDDHRPDNSHLVTAQAFAGSRAAERSREDAHA